MLTVILAGIAAIRLMVMHLSDTAERSRVSDISGMQAIDVRTVAATAREEDEGK